MTKAKNSKTPKPTGLHAKLATAAQGVPDTAPPTHTEAVPGQGASPPADSAAAAADPAPSAGTAITTAQTAGNVEPLKLTKQGHAELMSSLATGLRDTLNEVARQTGFRDLADASNFPHWVADRKGAIDALATYEAEVGRGA